MKNYEPAVQTWRSWKVASPEDIDLRLDSFRVLFAYHSGKIENEEITYHDTRDIFENGKVVGYTGSTRALFEQQNQKTCYEMLRVKFAAREPLTVTLIREIHRVLTEGTYDERRNISHEERPGEFKKHDYVERDLTELLEEVNGLGQKDPLIAGAYFHARFENIHPFADGNGRVGRTLLNYWLMINDMPPVIIYEEDKRSYYEALQQYDETESLDALIGFLKEQTVKTWDRSMSLSQDEVPKHRGLDTFLL